MPNWKGSTRKARLPKDWAKRRRHVLKRDKGICQHVRADTGRICGLKANEVDHRIPNDDDSYSNLVALCTWHHQRKSSSEGGRGNRKPPNAITDHPGFARP